MRQLISSYTGACEQLRTVGLSSSITGRLARLLLDWSDGAERTRQGTRLTLRPYRTAGKRGQSTEPEQPKKSRCRSVKFLFFGSSPMQGTCICSCLGT
jgi:hypothetical protein